LSNRRLLHGGLDKEQVELSAGSLTSKPTREFTFEC
jgi:hypothetical protein